MDEKCFNILFHNYLPLQGKFANLQKDIEQKLFSLCKNRHMGLKACLESRLFTGKHLVKTYKSKVVQFTELYRLNSQKRPMDLKARLKSCRYRYILTGKYFVKNIKNKQKQLRLMTSFIFVSRYVATGFKGRPRVEFMSISIAFYWLTFCEDIQNKSCPVYHALSIDSENQPTGFVAHLKNRIFLSLSIKFYW